jgi:hypothetical protein
MAEPATGPTAAAVTTVTSRPAAPMALMRVNLIAAPLKNQIPLLQSRILLARYDVSRTPLDKTECHDFASAPGRPGSLWALSARCITKPPVALL